jgi:integrase
VKLTSSKFAVALLFGMSLHLLAQQTFPPAAGTPILETIYVAPLTAGSAGWLTSIAWPNVCKIQPAGEIALRLRIPWPSTLQEDNARSGFLRDDEYAALLNALPAELKPLFVTAFETGMRKGELLAIRWDQADFESGFITLKPSETKRGKARTVPIVPGDMEGLLKVAKQEWDASWPDSPWVFNRQGERIKDFRRTWEKACESAGVPELKFHDLRRTTVRNMRKAGIEQAVRMKISGHRTDSMERRYNIVDEEDIIRARALMMARVKATKG